METSVVTNNGKPTVLVVDDEPDILFSLKALLRHDFDVATAEGGPQALESLAQRPAQVLMTDQRMPGMTGAELLAQARQISPDSVAIMFTGYADIKAVIDAVNRGHIFRYITKPWDPDDLAAVLSEAAAHYEQRAEQKRLLNEMRALLNHAVESKNGYQQLTRAAGGLIERLDRATAAAKAT